MTFGTLAAMMFSDLIMGRSNKYKKLFDPLRIPTIKQLMAKGSDYTHELFGGAFKNMIS